MEASLSEPRQYSAAVTTSRGIFIIGGGSRTRSMSRSVELVQLTKDKFEVSFVFEL
jgi:N-acetylneuraminic acid mutarotase